jgi:hypothetical protein
MSGSLEPRMVARRGRRSVVRALVCGALGVVLPVAIWSACIPCDLCEAGGVNDAAPGVDADLPDRVSSIAADGGSFCERERRDGGDYLACRDFDDGDAGLEVDKASLDSFANARLRVMAAAGAPSDPFVLRASGDAPEDGGSLEAFGRLRLTSVPKVIAHAIRVQRMGTEGIFSRVSYGGSVGNAFGVRLDGTKWAVFVKEGTNYENIKGVDPRIGTWVSIRYDIASNDRVTVTINDDVVIPDASVPPISSPAVMLGIAETSGSWEVDLDDAIVR